jgi:hypothetical protein
MEELHEMLLGMYPDLGPVIDQVLMAIDDLIAPHYNGYLGIDMMLYWDENGKIALNPCVEVNLRMTMGMVTAAMGSRHGLRGDFSIVADESGYFMKMT